MNTTIKVITTAIVVIGSHAECLTELVPHIAHYETSNTICTVLGLAFSVVIGYFL